MKASNKPANKRHSQSAKSATLGSLVSPASRVRTQLVLVGNGAGPLGLLSASRSTVSDRTSGGSVKLDDGVEVSDPRTDTDTKGASRSVQRYKKVRLCRVSGFGPNTSNRVHQATPSQPINGLLLPINPSILGPFQGSTTSTAPRSATFSHNARASAPVSVSSSHVLHQPPVQIIMPAVLPPTGIAPTPGGGTRPSTPEPEPLVDDLVSSVPVHPAGSSEQGASPLLHTASTCLFGEIQGAPVEARTQPPTTDSQLRLYDLGHIADKSQGAQASLSFRLAPVTQPSTSTTQGISGPSHEFGFTESDIKMTLSTGYASGFRAPWHSSTSTTTYSSTQGMAPPQEVQMDHKEPCSSDNIIHTTVPCFEVPPMSRDPSSYTDVDVSMDIYDAPTNTASTSTQQWDVPSSNSIGQIHASVDVVHMPFSAPVYQPEQPTYDAYSQVQVNQNLLYESVPSIDPYQLDTSNVSNYFSYNQGYSHGATDAFPVNAVAALNQALPASTVELATSWPNYHQEYHVTQPVLPTQGLLLHTSEPFFAPQVSDSHSSTSVTHNHLMARDQPVDQHPQCSMRPTDTPLSIDVKESPSIPPHQSSLASIAEPSSITLSGTQSNHIRPSSTFSSSSETNARAHRVLYRALPVIFPPMTRRDFSLGMKRDSSKGHKPATRISCSMPKRPRPRTMVFRAPDAHISTRAVPDRNARVKLARETTAPTTQPAKRNRTESDEPDEDGPIKRRRATESSVAPTRTTSTSPRLPRSATQKSRPRSARTCTDIIGRLVRQMVCTWW